MPANHGEMLSQLTQALEEEYEDMHLTTAGTEDGLVLVQMECRVPSVPFKAVEVAPCSPPVQLLH